MFERIGLKAWRATGSLEKARGSFWFVVFQSTKAKQAVAFVTRCVKLRKTSFMHKTIQFHPFHLFSFASQFLNFRNWKGQPRQRMQIKFNTSIHLF